jgi:hypothetical protein
MAGILDSQHVILSQMIIQEEKLNDNVNGYFREWDFMIRKTI